MSIVQSPRCRASASLRPLCSQRTLFRVKVGRVRGTEEATWSLAVEGNKEMEMDEASRRLAMEEAREMDEATRRLAVEEIMEMDNTAEALDLENETLVTEEVVGSAWNSWDMSVT